MGRRRWIGLALGIVMVAFAMSNARGVVGGSAIDQAAFQSDWPFAVGVFSESSQCTGTLVSPTHVLTAEHCLVPDEEMTVVARATDLDLGVVIDVTEQQEHPSLDLAILTLEESVTPPGLPIRTVTLDQMTALGAPFTGSFAGWGYTDANASVEPTSLNVGSDSIAVSSGFYVGDGPAGLCFGDSGGPLVATLADGEKALVGVSALIGGPQCNSSFAFVRVGPAADFIADIVPPITVSINDAKVKEGNNGTKLMTFTVSLAYNVAGDVTVSYEIADGKAKAGKDYVDASGTVTIEQGFFSAPLTVEIIGDRREERNEKLKVTLSDPLGAVIADGIANGTIRDND